MAAGTYYLGGYMYDGGKTFTTSYLSQAITITAAAQAQTFAVSGPSSSTYLAGQTVSIPWTAGNVVAGSKISLCYDTDTTFNGNEHWIEIDGVAAANGAGHVRLEYDRRGGGHVLPRRLHVRRRQDLHLLASHPGNHHHRRASTQPETFAVLGPTSGTYQAGQMVNIPWTAGGVVAGSTISLCYDTDTSFDGNEHWIEIDAVTAADGSHPFMWDTTGVAPGTYYLAGYMYDGVKTFTFSHLSQPITIAAALASAVP